jgi:catechol 2,3-dioxygenase-like lactoylglutathione lyase family enzyme
MLSNDNISADKVWPNGIEIAQVRVARPTDNLDELTSFYRDGLGLVEIGRFEDHDGYTGVMFGLPGRAYHLEFTQHKAGSPCPAPTRDNLLVFYLPNGDDIERLAERLAAMGYPEVEPENPYWAGRGITIEDPDGWRVVLMNTRGI